MICCFIYKTSENSENVDQCFSKAEDETSRNVSFLSQTQNQSVYRHTGGKKPEDKNI